MRNSMFLVITLLFVISCSDDDNSSSSCNKADWVGTYIGQKACHGELEEDYEFTISSVELPVDPPPDNFLVIDDHLFKFQDCLLANGVIGDTEFRTTGSLQGDQLTIETDSCNWVAIKQ